MTGNLETWSCEDLVSWLREQIAEAEKRAYERHEFGCSSFYNCGTCQSGPYGCDCKHPRAVSAQCEAHTALLDQYSERFSDLHVWGPIFRAAGLAYQHNPGYREEWRP